MPLPNPGALQGGGMLSGQGPPPPHGQPMSNPGNAAQSPPLDRINSPPEGQPGYYQNDSQMSDSQMAGLCKSIYFSPKGSFLRKFSFSSSASPPLSGGSAHIQQNGFNPSSSQVPQSASAQQSMQQQNFPPPNGGQPTGGQGTWSGPNTLNYTQQQRCTPYCKLGT